MDSEKSSQKRKVYTIPLPVGILTLPDGFEHEQKISMKKFYKLHSKN